jgi:hypothetical protein
MQTTRQRGGRVVYVAGSTRDFPESVQAWLSQAHVRAIASPHIYDALAMLTTHRRPDVLIVALEGVDWSEMEFFELARRVARDTTVYVTGGGHQQEKISSALERGALLFDPEHIAEDLARSERHETRLSTRELWSGIVEAMDAPRPDDAPPARRDETVPPSEQQPDSAARLQAPERREGMRLVHEIPCERATEADESLTETSASDEAEGTSEPSDTSDLSIPFPWSPSPARPMRTPPQARSPRPNDPPPETAPSTDPPDETAPPQRGLNVGGIELTAEELAALMGRRPPGTPPSREGRS